MHIPSTRILFALAYDRGEEYDPTMPVAPDLLEAMSLVDRARPVIGEDGPYERAPPAPADERDPGLVLGRGRDLGAVGGGRAAVRLTHPFTGSSAATNSGARATNRSMRRLTGDGSAVALSPAGLPRFTTTPSKEVTCR